MGPLRGEVLAGGIPFPPDTPEAILGTTTTEFLHTSMPSCWRFFGSSGLDRVIALYVVYLIQAIPSTFRSSYDGRLHQQLSRRQSHVVLLEMNWRVVTMEVRASVQVWTSYTKLLFAFSKPAHISIWILPSLQLNCWISAPLESCQSSTDDEGVGARLKCVLLWSISRA